MRSQGNSITKIVLAVTTLALLSACGHKKIKDDGASLQASIDLLGPNNTNMEGAASEDVQLEVPADTASAKTRKSSRSVFRKRAKKRMVAQPKIEAPQQIEVAAVAQTENIPASNENPDLKNLTVIDPSELPLAMGSVETPEPPTAMLTETLSEEVASEGLTIAIVGVSVAALAALAVMIQRRRNRYKLILN